jgi:hypothetical protein
MTILTSVRLTLAMTCLGCAAATSMRPREAFIGTLNEVGPRELQAVSSRMLYEALAELRPRFLLTNYRGETATVFINGALAGSTQVLQHISKSDVAIVRFLHGLDATQNHGAVHSGTVIEVTLQAR